MKKQIIIAVLALTLACAGCSGNTAATNITNGEINSEVANEAASSSDATTSETGNSTETKEDNSSENNSNEETPSKDTTEEVNKDQTPENETFPYEDEGSNDYTNGELTNVYAAASEWPFLCYTIGSEEKRMDFEMYKDYGMPEYEFNVQKKDLTGDGENEIIFSVHIVGNNIHDLLGDTYVFTVNDDRTDLKQILYVDSEGGEKYKKGCIFHVGSSVDNGLLKLDFCSGKPEGDDALKIESVYLKYENGEWKETEK